MKHIATLSNGRRVVLEERHNALSICLGDGASDDAADSEPEWYICEINTDGVLVMPNSGDATHSLTDGLSGDD